jgi:hypothetical protein
MSTDSSAFEERAPRVDLWRLPTVISVEARRVEYQKPRIQYVGTERREHRRRA